MSFGLSFADSIVIVVFFIGTTALGIWSGRKIGTTAEYFMPRRFGKFFLTLSAFSTATSTEQAVVLASKSYTAGVSGIWYQWYHLVTMPLYWLFTPMLRRFRAITIADIFGLRFDPSVAVLYSLTGLLKSVLSMGLLLKGSSALLLGISGGAVGGNTLIVILTVVFLSYSLFGGWTSAVFTSLIQGALTLLFAFLLLPFVWRAVGGMDGMRDTLSSEMFSLVVPDGINGFTLTMLALAGLIGSPMIPHNLGVSSASRRERDGQFGFVSGLFLKRICAAAWCLTGVAAAALYAGQQINPDGVYGQLARQFLPEVAPGLLGLFIASILADVMGTCSAMMNAASALLTQNLYRQVRPNRPDAHYLFVGRCGAVIVVVAGVGFAFWLPGVVKGLELILAATPIVGVVFWLGVFWRRTTTAAAWVSAGVGYGLWLLLQQQAVLGLLNKTSFFSERIVARSSGLEMIFSWQLFLVLTSVTVAAIVTSLFTRPTSQERLDRFYALKRTPVTGEENLPAPCTLPVGAVTPEPRIMTRAGGLELDWPDRRGATGFFLCGAIVVAMIGAFAWLVG